MSEVQTNASVGKDVRGRLKEQKTALIQDEVLGAAARLIAERGFRAVTVEGITSELGFTKSIVYYYFKNKNELLWKLFQRIDETYLTGLDAVMAQGGTPRQILTRIVHMHCMNVLLHLEWSTIYNRDENELLPSQQRIVAANKRIYNKRVQDLYVEGVRAGELRDIPAVIAVSCLIGACNWPYRWYKIGGKYSVKEIADGYALQLINGVAK